jgi:hypothetical protein
VSVDKTVDIPRRLPSREAKVLFPVPDVPASKTKIFRFDSKINRQFLFSLNIKIRYVSMLNWKTLIYTYALNRMQYKNPSNILV